jgi:hypothetical protein
MKLHTFGFDRGYGRHGKHLFISFIMKKGFLLFGLHPFLRFKFFKELPNAPWKSRLYIGPLEIERTRT